jgi:hypothetical protein
MNIGGGAGITSRKRVLVVGMLDSIHFARWLQQFVSKDIDFLIFPSKKFKYLHPNLVALLKEVNVARVELYNPRIPFNYFGFMDYFFLIILGKVTRQNLRALILRRLLQNRDFDFIHCLEIQGAGYLVTELDPYVLSKSKVIVTNWGSDIFYFRKDPKHLEMIKSCLKRADLYSAECARDYKLAEDLGFKGEFLPCIPNAGGFEFSLDMKNNLPSTRTQVLVKGYGGEFGRARIVTDILPDVLSKFQNVTFRFFSVTEDIEVILKRISRDFPNRVVLTTVKDKLSHSEMLSQFAVSRVYVGCSESDGISTSFLEALISGTYPIQTNTSCADEWVGAGISASIIGLSSEELLKEICKSLNDDRLVDSSATNNRIIVEHQLNAERIEKIAHSFYV